MVNGDKDDDEPVSCALPCLIMSECLLIDVNRTLPYLQC